MINLTSKIISLGQESNADKKIKKLLEIELIKNPNNIDLLFRLAILEQDPPLFAEDKSLTHLQTILTLDKDNIIAIILIAYINHNFCLLVGPKLGSPIINMLNELKTNNAELNSIIKYALSWFCWNKKVKESLLKASINFYQGHVWNYVHLAKLYSEQGRHVEAKNFYQKALDNVVKVYSDNDLYDTTDITEFLNERIKGIYLSSINLTSIKEQLEELETPA